MSEAEDTYTPAQAAEILRVSEPRIIQLITEGVLAGDKDEGGRWRIPRRAVHDRLGARLAVKPPPTHRRTPRPREADFYTPGEAARLLGLTEFTILGLLTSGQLEGHQDEQARWWIPAVAVDEAVRRSRGADAPVDPSAEETIAIPPVSPADSADEPASDETTQFEAVAGPPPQTSSTEVEEGTRRNTQNLDAEASAEGGWTNTTTAGKALGVSPRTVQTYIRKGLLQGKVEGEGVRRKWYVGIDSLNALRAQRIAEGGVEGFREGSTEQVAEGVAEAMQNLSERLADEAARAAEYRTRLELTEQAQSTIQEEARGLREENERLREELEAERSKGFWQRLFGGYGE
jgi:excisionase family DNA binding protein